MTRKNRRKDTDDMMMKTQALAAAMKNDPRWAAVEARDAGADGQARCSIGR